MEKINKKRAIAGFLLSFVFLFVFIYSVSGIKKIFLLGSISDAIVLPEIVVENNQQTNIEPSLPIKPEVNAASAISIESNLFSANKIIFEKDSLLKLPIASLTKLMTAIVVLDNYSLTATTTVSSMADAQNPMKQDVMLGQTMNIENFFNIMLVGSSNKSAYTLAEVMGEGKFVGLMNQKAREIGMYDTFFADPTGLSDNNISTASDLVKLAEHILKKYPKISAVSRLEKIDIPNFGQIQNTDQLLGEVPEIICGKTGFTNQAKGCLLLVMTSPKNDGYLINVVLGAEDRFLEMKKIINWSSAICK
jgi:D-alanyl-D-alanine carboxypeptidase